MSERSSESLECKGDREGDKRITLRCVVEVGVDEVERVAFHGQHDGGPCRHDSRATETLKHAHDGSVRVSEGVTMSLHMQHQVAHMAMLQWRMHQQQQAAAAYHANISQALFETEQTARRVAATVRRDVFAAAVNAAAWIRRVHGLHPGSFTDLHAKRAWADSMAMLEGAVRAGRTDGRVAQEVDRYLATMDQLAKYQQEIGADPAAYLARARAACAAVGKGIPQAIGAGLLAFLALMVFITGGENRAGGFFWLILACVVGVYYLKAHNRRRDAEARVRAAEAYVAEYQRFQADPAAGGWLQGQWAEHPFLFQEPPPDSTGPHSGNGAQVQIHSERKVVERQVVVVRCKFCKNLTPVDLPTCEHCGAAGFGSSQG